MTYVRPDDNTEVKPAVVQYTGQLAVVQYSGQLAVVQYSGQLAVVQYTGQLAVVVVVVVVAAGQTIGPISSN